MNSAVTPVTMESEENDRILAERKKSQTGVMKDKHALNTRENYAYLWTRFLKWLFKEVEAGRYSEFVNGDDANFEKLSQNSDPLFVCRYLTAWLLCLLLS